MPSKVFNTTPQRFLNGTLLPGSASYYLELVTAEPTAAAATRADLTLATGGNYSSIDKSLAGKAASLVTTNDANLTFTSKLFTGLTSNGTAILGAVLLQGNGATPQSTDPAVAYYEFASSYTPNGADFTVTLPSDFLSIVNPN